MYVCQLSFSYYGPHLDRLPEATSCCLQTYNVNDVLLVMYCMCLPAFLVTRLSPDKGQL